MIANSILACLFATVPLDPLTTRWTFGAHEPYPMYRRMGKKSTGGIEGSAKWLKDWLNWWDAKAPETMHELGLNGLHSRFYKGMGWEEEKKDFPNVQKFVRNCHANGVTALAYVQFATLYFEPMLAEIPDLERLRKAGSTASCLTMCSRGPATATAANKSSPRILRRSRIPHRALGSRPSGGSGSRVPARAWMRKILSIRSGCAGAWGSSMRSWHAFGRRSSR